MRNKILVLAGALFIMSSCSGWAEEKAKGLVKYNLGKVFVSATKTQLHQAEIGSSSTVITEEEIRKSGRVAVLEVLRDTPGVAVSQSGPFGGLAYVYLRGSKPGHTLVMIDGVEANDPMSTDRSFNFANLTVDNIEQIEIIRGPQSALYGSDAMSGVINIITKKGEGVPRLEVSTEGGSCRTYRESASASGGTKWMDYSVGFSQNNSRGVSKARYGSDPDGYDNTTLSGRLGLRPFSDAKLDLYSRFTDVVTDLDDGSYEDDPNYTMWERGFVSKAEFAQAIKSWWDHRFSFSYSDITRKYRDSADGVDRNEDSQSWYKGDVKKIEWQHNLPIFEWNTVTAGAEFERERGSSYNRSRTTITKIDRRHVDTQSCYLQDQLKAAGRLFVTPGVRIDYHQLFKTETTYKVSAALLVPEMGARLKFNMGSGFKAPSLFQLYSIYGNEGLKPDKSFSLDFGVEEEFMPNILSCGVTYFHNDFKDMVDWDSVASRYKNIGRAKTWGYESAFTFKPIETLSISLNYTYAATMDVETGKRLPRRPENDVGIGVGWGPVKNAKLNLKTRYVDRTWNDSNNNQKVKPYTVVDLFASYDLAGHLQLFGRVENLLDRRYEEVYGFSALGRALYIGAKANF